MIITSNRASAVLYQFLKSKSFDKPFLLPANACPVVPLSFLKAGVDFDFVDIDATHAMSKDIVLEKLKSNKYSGMVFIHAYGKKFDNASFYKEMKEDHPDFCVIDDRCLCQPELSDEQMENVDLTLYSTGYAKYVELSFGGYGVVHGAQYTSHNTSLPYSEEAESNQQVYLKECLREGMVYGFPADYPWLNVSPLQLTQEQYFITIREKLSAIRAQKTLINHIYKTLLPKEIQWGEDFNNWRFMVSVDNRDRILDAIFADGLFAGANYPSVSYLFKREHSPHAEEEALHTLNLFNNHKADETFAVRICEIINTFL